MDDTARNAIITAAVTAAGPASNYANPADYSAAVTGRAVDIAVMCRPESTVAKAIDSIEASKVFVGTITAVTKEQKSTRGLITLKTGTNQEKVDGITKQPLPAGCEQVRTDRTDNPVGRAVAIKARELIGHRVVVHVEVEEFNGGSGKVRVLRHVESLGVDKDFAQSA